VLSVLGGLRDIHVGKDTELFFVTHSHDYHTIMSSYSFGDILKEDMHTEKGCLAIYYFGCRILGHENWSLFIFQIITISCIYIGAYKHRKIISLPFFWLIFCFFKYNTTYNIMRQILAFSIMFAGIDHLENRRYKKFSLYLLAAYLFHTSALINFPFFIGLHMVTTSKSVIKSSIMKIFITAGIVLALISIMPIMMQAVSSLRTVERYTYYINMQAKFSNNVAASFVAIMIVELVVLMLYSKQAEKVLLPVRGGITFYEFDLFFCIAYQLIITFFSERVLMYFDFLNVLLLASMPRFFKNKYNKFFMSIGIIATVIFYWWYVYINAGANGTWPYKSIL